MRSIRNISSTTFRRLISMARPSCGKIGTTKTSPRYAPVRLRKEIGRDNSAGLLPRPVRFFRSRSITDICPSMKGNFSMAGLLVCWMALPSEGQVQIQQIQQFQQFQPGLNLMQFGNQNAKVELMPDPISDVLGFVDGSALHGELSRMDLEHGLTWAQAEARNPIHFHPDHLDFVRFAHAHSVSVRPTCHLWFANGDDLYGAVTSLDDQRLGFHTWFGGSMVLPRLAVRAITLLASNYSVLYEGPYDAGGWMVVNNTPKSWTFRDGAFFGTGAGP